MKVLREHLWWIQEGLISLRGPVAILFISRDAYQEDINGEKLTVKKWWIFGADFHGLRRVFSRFIRDINGEKKTSRYWWSFSRLVFHGLPPLELTAIVSQNAFVLVFVGGGGAIAQLSRDMLQNGVSHRCACVKLSTKGGYRTILGSY